MQSNILILADMEGCAGITDMKQYDICRERMIEEVERVIQSIETYDKGDVTIADCHNDGKNIVPFFAEKGYLCYEHIWSIKNIEQYDCAMLIGFHAKNGGTGFCPHTIRPDVQELFLGEKSIGEVELLINWLAGHGVPVLFISGDEAVKKELDGYVCEFYASNKDGMESLDRQTLLERMEPHMKRALESQNGIEPRYNDRAIKVKLIGESYYKWMPHELFSIEEGMVIFPDTESFMMSLLSFCRFLNIAEEYQSLRMRHLVGKIRTNSACVEGDAKGKELLKQKEWRALSDEDIEYLYGLLESDKNDKRGMCE